MVSLISSFVFGCLNTLGDQCQMRFRYLDPRLKSFIFQVLQWSFPTLQLLALMKGKLLILKNRVAFLSPTMVVNQNNMICQRQRIIMQLLPLPPPGWVNYQKKWVLQKPDIMGPLHSWTPKKSSIIPLGSNQGFILRLDRIRNHTMHREI